MNNMIETDDSRNRSKYTVWTAELGPAPTPELANIDSLDWEPPPCPLCGSAYVEVMSHGGPDGAWLECFLGHCVEAEHGELGRVSVKIVDKPRITISMAINWNAVLLSGARAYSERMDERLRMMFRE